MYLIKSTLIFRIKSKCFIRATRRTHSPSAYSGQTMQARTARVAQSRGEVLSLWVTEPCRTPRNKSSNTWKLLVDRLARLLRSTREASLSKHCLLLRRRQPWRQGCRTSGQVCQPSHPAPASRQDQVSVRWRTRLQEVHSS